MGLAAQRRQMTASMIDVDGLIEPDTAALQHLIRPDDEGARMARRYMLCLQFGQGRRDLGGGTVAFTKRVFYNALINRRGIPFDGNAGIAQ